jgi:hypothetical protein
MQMRHRPEPGHVDMQGMTDEMAGIYEAVATLEYSGSEPSRSALAAATGLPDRVLDQDLTDMSSLGLLVAEDRSGEVVYRPARRGWSTQPGQAEGKKLS